MKNADKERELLALGKEIADRRQVIVDEWKKTHEMPLRGIANAKAQKELDLEAARRYGEILEKYKDK